VLHRPARQAGEAERDKQAKHQELAATRKESIAKLSAPIDGRVEEALRLNREMYRSVVQQACE
jgi:hypothetical protein